MPVAGLMTPAGRSITSAGQSATNIVLTHLKFINQPSQGLPTLRIP